MRHLDFLFSNWDVHVDGQVQCYKQNIVFIPIAC